MTNLQNLTYTTHFGFEGFGRQVHGPVNFQLEGFRGGGLPEGQAFAFIVGHGHRNRHPGGQKGPGGLPVSL